jgi:hypothetical protein
MPLVDGGFQAEFHYLFAGLDIKEKVCVLGPDCAA